MNKECPLPPLISDNESEIARRLYESLESYWRTLGIPGSLREYLRSLPPTNQQDAITGPNARALKIVRSADLSLQSALYSLKNGRVRDAWQDFGYVTYCVGLINGLHAAEADNVRIEELLRKQVREPQRLRSVLSEAISKAIREFAVKDHEVPTCNKLQNRFQRGYQPAGIDCYYDKSDREYVIEGERFTSRQFRDAYNNQVPGRKVS